MWKDKICNDEVLRRVEEELEITQFITKKEYESAKEKGKETFESFTGRKNEWQTNTRKA